MTIDRTTNTQGGLRSPALFTDLYELTMAQAYWESGKRATATFSLYFREFSAGRGYMVFGGLSDALTYLEGFRFDSDDLEFLASMEMFKPPFLEFLSGLRFTGSVRAMREGTVFFPDEPVLEVTAPVIEAQLVETYLLNQISLQSLLATKASRVVYAARGRGVSDFASRRTQGTDSALKLARVGYMVGFEGTSNVLAARQLGIPAMGTMAHSFITTFDTEIEAYRAYARSFPDSSTFIVDTYDTLEGVSRAIQVAQEMRAAGDSLRAVRLDSGDLADLSTKTRALLDDAGLGGVRILASGGLDEFAIEDLVRAGAPIDGFGVGTRVGVSADAPSTDSIYKQVEYDGRPVLKLSPGKPMLPGGKQVYRSYEAEGCYAGDLLALAQEPDPDGDAKPLLGHAMQGGRRTADSPSLSGLRQFFVEEFERLPERHKSLTSPEPYPVEVSAGLKRLNQQVIEGLRKQNLTR